MNVRELRIPPWLALAWFRAVIWFLVARCWWQGGDHVALRRALDQQLILALRYGRGGR